jgi:hypothetical protein
MTAVEFDPAAQPTSPPTRPQVVIEEMVGGLVVSENATVTLRGKLLGITTKVEVQDVTVPFTVLQTDDLEPVELQYPTLTNIRLNTRHSNG